MDDATPPIDPFEVEEQPEQPVGLSWAFDTSLNNGLHILGKIANGAELSVASMKALHENGLSADLFSFDFRVSPIDSALIVSGLQALGLVCRDTRDDIADLILRIGAAQVPPTPEQDALIKAASEQFAESFFGMADEVGPSEAASNN